MPARCRAGIPERAGYSTTRRWRKASSGGAALGSPPIEFLDIPEGVGFQQGGTEVSQLVFRADEDMRADQRDQGQVGGDELLDATVEALAAGVLAGDQPAAH